MNSAQPPRKPLSGQVVMVTRAAESSAGLRRMLEAAGASVVELPMVMIIPVSGNDAVPVAAAAHEFARGQYDAAVFTSRNSVVHFSEHLRRAAEAQPPDYVTPCFAIGPATAQALIEFDITTRPIITAEAVSESLLETIRGHLGTEPAGRRLLFPRAREGRDCIIEGLRTAGVRVEVVTVYETRPVTEGTALPEGRLDWVTFTSPSTVRAFETRFGRPRCAVACIGPVTSDAARRVGFDVSCEAIEHTARGLVDAIIMTASRTTSS